MKKAKTISLNVGIALALFAVFLVPAASATTVSIGSTIVGEGETGVVSLMVNDVTDLGGVHVNLTYDASVVNVTALTNSDFDSKPNLYKRGHGWVLLEGGQYESGLSGSVKLCDVTLEAVGKAGESSYLNLTDIDIETFTYPPTDIPIDEVINGTFTIKPVTPSAKVVINEFEQNPPGDDSGNEWIELYNNDSTSVNIGGWKLINSGGKVVTIPDDTVIAVHGYWVANWTNGSLEDSNEYITLYNATGTEIDNTLTAADGNNDERCWARYPNGIDTDSDNDWKYQTSTMGETNGVLVAPVDTTPPTTNVTAPPTLWPGKPDETTIPSGTPLPWTSEPVQLWFFRTDNSDSGTGVATGVAYTNLSLASESVADLVNVTISNNTWTWETNLSKGKNTTVPGTVGEYFNVTISEECNATIEYYSVDKNETANVETMKSLTVRIRFEIPFSVIPYGTAYTANVTHDSMSANVGKDAKIVFFAETATIDSKPYYVLNISKPVGGTEMYAGINETAENFTMKRLVMKDETGEIMNLTFNPEYTMLNYPLWVGKTWASTINVSGTPSSVEYWIIASKKTWSSTINVSGTVTVAGATTQVDDIITAEIEGKVTGEEYLTTPYGELRCLVVENNASISVSGLSEPITITAKYWISDHETAKIPKYQSYTNGVLREELVLKSVTTSISKYYNVSITAEPSVRTVNQSENATYMLTVTNFGNAKDIIKLDIVQTEAAFAALSADNFTLNASESATACLNVSDPSVGIYNTTVKATSQSNASVFDEVMVNTMVQDSFPPHITINTPVAGWYNTDIMVNATVTDEGGSGLKEVKFRWETATARGNWQPMSRIANTNFWTATFDITGIEEGNYTIRVNAADNATNENTSTVANIAIDKTRPTFSITIEPNFSKKWANITVNASEVLSRKLNVTITLDGTVVPYNEISWVPPTWSGNYSIATPGNYTILVSGSDRAGNEGISVANSTISYVTIPANTLTEIPAPPNTSINITLDTPVSDAGISVTETKEKPSGVVIDPTKIPVGFVSIDADTEKINESVSVNMTIRIYYDETEIITKGTTKNSLAIYWFNSTTGWEQLPSVVDETGNYVEATVKHLGYFGLMGVDTAPPAVTVISPNGGEELNVSTSYKITWDASDNVGVTSVDIYYSTDGGATYHNIATGEANDGAYNWTVPNTPSTRCKVKVVAHDAAANAGEDVSDDVFEIVAVITPTPTPTPAPARHAGGGGGGGAPRDSDGDGIMDIAEMIQGTNPKDPCDPNPECAACKALMPAAPAPTTAPVVSPTPKPTVKPTPVPTPAPATPTPTPKPTPGYEAVFMIAGLLAVAYLVQRKRRK